MGFLRSLALASACFALVISCHKSRDEEVDPRYSFSPKNALRTCGADADCVIVQYMTNCSRCCGQSAVTRGAGEKGYAEAESACRDSDAPIGGECLRYCGEPRPACFEGTCVLFDDRPGTASSRTCSQDAGTKVTSGAPGDLGPGPACGATAVKTGFEDVLDPSWKLTTPSAFQIDTATPLNGGASLRISYRQQEAFFAIPQPDACGVRIAFTVRTKLLANGLSLARIVAGDGAWFHVQLESCGLSVWEEMRDAVASGGSFGGAKWPVPDDTAVRVVLTFDVRGKSITSTAAPVGQPLPAAQATPMRSNATSIRSIELGSTDASVAIGTVWLDDLTID